MGILRMGPPEELVLRLANRFNIETFVETGTYRGTTAAWAATHFRSVYTIEQSAEFYEKARLELVQYKNITVLHADSSDGLRELSSKIHSSCLFWLDAHWSGGGTAGAERQCPLLDEIRSVALFSDPKAVLVDDARLFLSTPQPPHDPHQWPDIADIVQAFGQLYPKNYLAVIEDVIACVPDSIAEVLRGYCRDTNEAAWRAHGDALRKKQAAEDRQARSWVSSLRNVFSR
jgi:hypothetical protein